MEDSRKPTRKSRAKVAKQAVSRSAAKAAPLVVEVRPAARRKAKVAAAGRSVRPAADREARIRMAAYLRAERGGFAPGREWEDWLAAEVEVDAQSGGSAAPRGKSVSS